MDLILISFLSGLFTWFLTSVGAGMIFLSKNFSRKFIDGALGLSAGIMLSLSIWSLLIPSVEISKDLDNYKLIPPVLGFLIGSFFMYILDNFAPHLHIFDSEDKKEGLRVNFKKTTLLFLAMTIHNFPEGLAIGVNIGSNNILSGLFLALAVGIQNIPEGLAISLPLHLEGLSKSKSFYYGQISAIVEPIGAVLGCLVVSLWRKLLPYALSFAAGAMVYVVVEELIPESQKAENTNLATLSLLVGFILMMILDLSFN
ncbi:MAG: ZIP family metal transporter [Endomicrobia bacterium]|nr:ZIP family metal transporter [Endomicrobiia bacterium]